MSDELQLALKVLLKSDLPQGLRKDLRAIDGFSKSGEKKLKRLGRAQDKLARGFGGMGRKMGALLGGAALAKGAKDVMDIEERYERLGVQAKISTSQVSTLKGEIRDTANQKNIRIDDNELLSAVEKIIEKTGDLEFAKDNLENIALAIQATGAAGGDIGAIVAEFKKLGIITPDGVLTALDTLTVQGKAGAFTLQDVASQGERAVSMFAAMGYEGQTAIQSMGALLQVSRMGTANAESASTAYEGMLRAIIEKGKDLQAAGIDVFDAEKLKHGVEEFKPMVGIIKEILAATDGKASILTKIFGAEGFRAISASAAEFKKAGATESLDKFMAIEGDGAAIRYDSKRIAKTASGAWNAAKNTTVEVVDDVVGTSLKAAVDIVNMDDANGKKHLRNTGYGELLGQYDNFYESKQKEQAKVLSVEKPEARLIIEVQDNRTNVKKLEAKSLSVEVDTGEIMQ